MNRFIFLFLVILSSSLMCEENPPTDFKEEVVETHAKVTIDGKEVPYTAQTGVLPIKDSEGKVKAGMFFVSYLKEGVEDNTSRPITFCFNGGPGCSSIWLHMGAFGPKRVVINKDGSIAPPYEFIDNAYSILDKTDLVFIDPISTGFSKALPGEDPKQFHDVDKDVNSVADFIQYFTSKYKRWDSPKYLAGESYGTMRAISLALKLHEDNMYYLNGLVLISCILDYQTVSDYVEGNDLPNILSLPSYTATAWYHKKLSPELQSDLDRALKEAQAFAQNDYAPALLKGDQLSDSEKKEIAKKLSRLTGMPEAFILTSDLNLQGCLFRKELLRSAGETVGRFDSRFVGNNGNPLLCYAESDPSLDAIAGAYTATFNQYVRTTLNWDKNDNYKVIGNVNPWNWGKATNCFHNVSDKFRNIMTKNPNLKVFVGVGTYDLAIPYFAPEFSINHLFLPPSIKKNISIHRYDAGHMMYIYEPALVQLKKDLSAFYEQ